MSLFELFSKRKRRERGEFPDIYTYDNIPQALKVQIVHIIKEIYFRGSYLTDEAGLILEKMHQILCREYGVFYLVDKHTKGYEAIGNFILKEANHEKILDAVELVFRFADRNIRESAYYYNENIDIDEALLELNSRFREAGIGYQFESGEIIRVDSQLLHSSAVKPALALLRTQVFSTVNQEFLSAHEHYRNGKYEECIADCNKSFESMLKVICTKKKWHYDPNDTAKKLITICLTNNLLPNFMQNQLTVMQSVLESGVPTVRNKMAGHGQGPQQRTVPSYIAEYIMHLTASTLLLLGVASNLGK
jgi:AbiJ N-terminal domain 4